MTQWCHTIITQPPKPLNPKPLNPKPYTIITQPCYYYSTLPSYITQRGHTILTKRRHHPRTLDPRTRLSATNLALLPCVYTSRIWRCVPPPHAHEHRPTNTVVNNKLGFASMRIHAYHDVAGLACFWYKAARERGSNPPPQCNELRIHQ